MVSNLKVNYKTQKNLIDMFYVLLVLFAQIISYEMQAAPTDYIKRKNKSVVRTAKNIKISSEKQIKSGVLLASSSSEKAQEFMSLSLDTTITDEALSGELSVHDIGRQTSTPESRRLFNNIFALEQAVVCDDTLTQDRLKSGYFNVCDQYKSISKQTSCKSNDQNSLGLSMQGQRYAQASIASLEKSIDTFEKN